MAKLQASYETMSDVPAGYEGAFDESDGKAVFSGGEFEFKTEAELNDMHKKKQDGHAKYHEANDKLKAFAGIDPTKHRSMVEELDMLRANRGNPGDEEKIASIVKTRVDREMEELNKINSDLTTERDELREYKQSSKKRKALAKIIADHVSDAASRDAEFIIGQSVERLADGSYVSKGTKEFEKGLPLDKMVSQAADSRPHWKKQSHPGHGAGGSNTDAAKTVKQRFDALYEKKEPLSFNEKRELQALASKLKSEGK